MKLSREIMKLKRVSDNNDPCFNIADVSDVDISIRKEN